MADLMPQACSRCWKRKQKCDRELPDCLKCREAGSVCVQRRMGVVLDPSQPDATSYIEGLQRRVQQLELAAGQASHTTPAVGSVSPGRAHAEQSAQNDQQETADSTMHVMDYLPLSAMAELRDRQQTSVHQYSFQTFLLAAASVFGSDPTTSDKSNTTLSESLEAFQQNISPEGLRVSRTIADMPVERYLSTCDVMCPFIDRDSFFARYAQIMAGFDEGKPDELASQAPHDVLIVYLAIATGILMSPDYRYKEGLATVLARKASKLMNPILSGSDNASIVKSLIALTIHSMYSTLGGSTWHFLGLAWARAIAAGMHTEGVSDCRATAPEKRENSRLFWSLYVLDASITFTLDRPSCLQDRDITAPMPYHTNGAASSSSPDTLACVVQYAHLVREVRRSPSMGTIFHLANYRHWKENSRDQLLFALPSDNKDMVVPALSSMSCKLILQISQATYSEQNHVQATAHTEITSLLDVYQRRSEAQDCVLTAFDGIDLFSIAIFMLDEHHRIPMPGRVESSRPLRACLQLLSSIADRFTATRLLLDVLWTFIDLVAGEGDTAEIDVFRLDQECHKLGVKLPSHAHDQMRAILMQRTNVHLPDTWSRSRRETMPSI